MGPGSFTGLRIGIAFVKGFFFGRPVKVMPVSSLQSMAGSWQCRGRPIVCASDARNNHVFWARFSNDEGRVGRVSEDTLSSIEEFRTCVGQDDIVLTDTLGYAKSAVFDFLKARPDAYSVEHHALQRGLSCALIAARAIGLAEAWVAAERIVPNYLNTTMAEKKQLSP